MSEGSGQKGEGGQVHRGLSRSWEHHKGIRGRSEWLGQKERAEGPGGSVTGPRKADGATSMCWSLDSAENIPSGLENLPRNHPGKKSLLGAIWGSPQMSRRHSLDQLYFLPHSQSQLHRPGFDYEGI